MSRRWSKQVERGAQLIYSYMSCELDNGQASMIECRNTHLAPRDGFPGCGKCEECLNAAALGAALDWLGGQIDKHAVPRPAKESS